MINIKTKEEIEMMRQGGRILAQVLFAVLDNVGPGISELELDRLAEKLIRDNGAESGFKRVRGYKHTICTSVNNVIVHGIPTERVLSEGDVVGVDCGVYYKGFNTDMAETIIVESSKLKVESDKRKFLETGKRALGEAIKQARVGNRVGHISKIIQEMVEKAGYSVVRSLVGHGVGRELHEEPQVPGFLTGLIDQTEKLREGMTIAIEVIYNMGRSEVILSDDGWTIKTKDDSLSGLFEKTVAITENGPLILTQ